jgi:tRNA pseudouridine32 synthase/23S rRNA pseudouridine746 synthase
MAPSSLPRELHIEVDAPAAALDLLASASGLSRARLKGAMTKGAVWRTRGKRTERVRRAKTELRPGDELHLYFDPRILDLEPPAPALIADEGAFSVWVKPYGLRSQGSKWGDHWTLGRWAERHLEPQRPAFTVHRLDRATRGLMVLAHGKGAAATLSKAFRERQVEKHYQAIVHGAFPTGDTPIEAEVDGRPARSVARLLDHDSAGARSLVEVRIETGRKHQVRVHLAGRGHPIVGDRLHGRDGDVEDLQLVAVLLAFPHPESGAYLRYELPAELLPGL